MQIVVNQISTKQPICVTVDEVCNHADIVIDDVSLNPDPSETEKAGVCEGCGAIYNRYEDEWMK